MSEPIGASALEWLVASVRMLGLFVAAPVFGHLAVPVRVRVGLALVAAASVGPEVSLPWSEDGPALAGLAAVVLQEILLGLSLGFAVSLVFGAFHLLGEFVSVQGGLGAATVLDPASQSSSLALASTFHAFMVMAFLAIDGHHDLLRAIAASFEALPIGGDGVDRGSFLAIARMGAGIFEIAVQLAAPITVAMLLSNIGVGILGRAIPQLNLMMLQLPAHLALTFALLILGAGALVRSASDTLGTWTVRSFAAVAGGG